MRICFDKPKNCYDKPNEIKFLGPQKWGIFIGKGVRLDTRNSELEVSKLQCKQREDERLMFLVFNSMIIVCGKCMSSKVYKDTFNLYMNEKAV